MKSLICSFFLFTCLSAFSNLKESLVYPYPDKITQESQVIMASSPESNYIVLYYPEEKIFQFFQTLPAKYIGQFQDNKIINVSISFSKDFDIVLLIPIHLKDTVYNVFELPTVSPVDYYDLKSDYANKINNSLVTAKITGLTTEKETVSNRLKIARDSRGIIFYENEIKNYFEQDGFKYLSSCAYPQNYRKHNPVLIISNDSSDFLIADYLLLNGKHQFDIFKKEKCIKHCTIEIADYQGIAFLPDQPKMIIQNSEELFEYNLLTGEADTILNVPEKYNEVQISTVKSTQSVDLLRVLVKRENEKIDFYKSQNNTINFLNGFKEFKQPELLDNKVNSTAFELSPIISPDGKYLFITRDNTEENKGGYFDQDIWYTTMEDGHPLKEMMNIESLNNKYPSGIISCSSDNNSIIISGSYSDQQKESLSPLSRSIRTESGWSYPEEIIIDDYINTANSHSFAVSPDEQYVLMSVERTETFGNIDLYVSQKIGENHYSKPINLGPVINTFANDFAPFLSADNTTLYFSSYGHPGFGSADVFMTKRLDGSWTNWSAIQNLGKSINDENWNAYFSISASGKYACLIKNTDDNLGEVLVATLPDEAQPNPVVLIKGKVFNLKNEPLGATIVYKDLSTGKELSSISTSIVDGTYQIIVPYGKKYSYYAELKGYYPLSENIDLSELNEYKEITKDLFLQPLETGEKIRMNNIFFDFNKTELLEESQEELNRLVAYLLSEPSVSIRIEGHTDNKGTSEYNLKLSHDRSKSVYSYLLSKGISHERLKWIGYGETKPLAPNDTEEEMRRNRRVEFVIL